MKITLVGYMGAGKSQLGLELSKKLNLPFIDLDKEIEKASGYTITETILNKGEFFFRKLEREMLMNFIEGKAFVLSTGGGTPAYYDNIEMINRNSVSVYLQYSVPELYDRLEGHQSERPLIAHLEGEALKEFIGKHVFERKAFYERAILTIKAGKKSQEQIINEIIDFVHE